MGKFLKPSVGLSVGKLDWVCVELLRNCQPSFCRQKVSLEVKRLVVLVSARWLHGCLLGLLITFPRYKQFGTKLSPIFGFAKSSKCKPIFPLSLMPNLLVACVVPSLCVLRCLRIRRYKSSLKRQHNFIRDDRLYEGSETSYAKKRGGLTKDCE